MKQYFLKPLTLRLVIISVLIIAALVIHSCKKDKQEKITTTSIIDPRISRAKQWYDSTYTLTGSNSKQSTQSIGSRYHDWSKKFLPYWAGASMFSQDGLTFIELPAIKKGDMALAFTKPKDTANFDFGRSGTLTHLLIVKQQNNLSMYAMTIVADTSYLKGDYSKLAHNSYQKMDGDFTGAVLFNKMDGTFVNGWRYQNGAVTSRLSPTSPTQTIQSIQSTSKLKVNVTEPIPPGCGAIVVVTLWEDCSYYENDVNDLYPFDCYTYTTTDVYADCSNLQGGGSGGTSSGGSTPPPPCVPPPAASSTPPPTNSTASVTGKLIINVTQPLPGGGGTTPPPPPLQPCVTVVKPVSKDTTTKKDPCAEKKTVGNTEANAIIANQNAQILANSTTYEYGTSQNLTSLDGSTYENTPVNTNSSTNTYTPTFSWDSVNGYTIGFSHGHPGNNAPDPYDVFPMIYYYSNNSNIASASSQVKQFYQSNVSSTIVTQSGNYVVTVNNWSALQTVYNSYSSNTQAFKNNYLQLTQTNQNNNPDATLVEAGEYALLKMFGNAINLYVADPDSTTYTPLIIDSSGVVAKKQCQ